MIKILFLQKFEVFFDFVYLFAIYSILVCNPNISKAEFSVISVRRELFVR